MPDTFADIVAMGANINSHGVGIGLVGLVDANAQISDGLVDAMSLPLLGLSDQHAIIWRGPGQGLYRSKVTSPCPVPC